MSINFEIKGMLAKCLASENLIVEHKRVETACFNVHTRVLTLPMWEHASDSIYTMLVLHEISHALWSPDFDWAKTYDISPQIVNVCEDVRVEKLCKRKYPGSPKSFYSGYKELVEEDFFQIKEDDLETYNFADRVNLYFKIGSFVDVPIKPGEESDIIDIIASTETFEDVLKASEILYNYCKKDKNLKNLDIDATNVNVDGVGGNNITTDSKNKIFIESDQPNVSGESSTGTSKESNDDKSSDLDEKIENVTTGGGNNLGGEEKSDIEVSTMDKLSESISKITNQIDPENFYVEIPKIEIDNIIIPNQKIHNDCKECWNRHNNVAGDIFSKVDSDYQQFKRSSQREVSYMVKEFECKKAASSYSRSSTSQTGILDCSKIHSYKFNDDIFKKITTVADGKSHGLVFILDWSSSMAEVILDTIKQLYNIIWFCRKVSIPFEVYAFTTDYPYVTFGENANKIYRKLSYEKKSGVLRIAEHFSLMNLFTSKVSSRRLEEDMLSIYRICYSFVNHYVGYSAPTGMSLSGTPLNETLMTLNYILPNFQKENNVEKVHCIILTDGESSPTQYHREFQRHFESDPYVGVSYVTENTILRDRVTGNTYNLDSQYTCTDVFLKNLRDRFLNVNFIGIRVLRNSEASILFYRYSRNDPKLFLELANSWKKTKSFNIKNSGYNAYFGMASSTLSQDCEFDVEEDSSKVQIKRAFIKSLKSKKLNKKILGEFISLIS